MPSGCRLSMSIGRKWMRGMHWVLAIATVCATDLRVEYTNGLQVDQDHLGLDGRQPPRVRVDVVGADVCLEIPRVGPGQLVVVEAVPLDQVLEVGAEQAMLLEALDRPLAADLPPRPATRVDVQVSDVQVSESGGMGGH